MADIHRLRPGASSDGTPARYRDRTGYGIHRFGFHPGRTDNNRTWLLGLDSDTSGIICVIYVFVGRRYIHQRVAVKTEKTNIDTIIGKRGFVTQDISQKKYGVVKVGMEEWRAKADEDIKKGEEITVTEISGVTLNVKRVEGGNT